MNVSVWDPRFAQTLLGELLAEHLGRDIGGMSDRKALRLFKEVAAGNRAKQLAGETLVPGLAPVLLPL